MRLLATCHAPYPMPRVVAVFIGVFVVLAAASGTASAKDGATGNFVPPLSSPTAVEPGPGQGGLQNAHSGQRDEPRRGAPSDAGIETPEQPGRQAAPAGKSDELRRLQDVLAERGWLVRWDSAGNLYLVPRADPSAPAAATEESSAAAPGAADLHQLQQLLGPVNWRMAEDSAGNIYLFQSHRGPDASPIQRDDASPAPPQTGAEPRLAPVVADPDRQREPGAGGATVISFEDVRALLATRGWKLETDPAGNWLLTPRGKPEPQSEGSAAAKSARAAPAIASAAPAPSSTERRPVSGPTDAATRAAEWLARTGKAGLAVGAVRRIHQVFLVSIVGETPPHRLKNQLAIRVEDGHVVPLLDD